MSEHFQGKFEAELKYHLKRPQDFIDALQLAGATLFISKNDETDWYLEHPNTPFPAPYKFMRKKNGPSGINLLIVKGPEQAQCEAVKIEDAEKRFRCLKH